MRRRLATATVSALALIAVAVQALAQSGPRSGGIRLGQTVEGALAARDAGDADGARHDAFAFRAREGDRFAVSLDADDFDPLVVVGQGTGGDFVELARNDDSAGGGLNSYLVFTAPRSGSYVIRAQAVSEDPLGTYALTLGEAPEPLSAQDIAIGDSVSGDLIEGDGINEAGARADAYRFSGRADQRVSADMTSAAFDAYLELFSEIVGVRTSLDTDDDGGALGTDARLVFTLPTDGDYVLEARAFSEGSGGYQLNLAEVEAEPAPAALAFGTEAVQGEIADADPTDDEDRGYDAYGFSGVEGSRVQIVMRSGDFDTFLQIGKAGGEFEMLASDDDGLGEGTDSRLNYILPEAGDYVVRASPLGSEEDGLYSIELTDRGPQPVAGSIVVGATARGTLTETDAIADDGNLYDAYAVTVGAGDKLTLTMVSNEFDSVLEVGRDGEDGRFESVATDDDGLSDTHAKIDWTVEGAGDYVIRARSFAQGQLGAYAMTVEPRP